MLRLLLTVFVGGYLRRESAQKELADQIIESVAGRTDKRIAKGKSHSTVPSRIVKIRDTAGGEAAKYARVVWLLAPVVTSCDYCPREGIEDTRADAA